MQPDALRHPDADVAIVGAGFAGALTALALRRCGRSVVLLERGRHPRFAIGESSTPLANLLINVLIPVMALSFLSKDPAVQVMLGKAAKPWHIGPVKALIVALALPLGQHLNHPRYRVSQLLRLDHLLGRCTICISNLPRQRLILQIPSAMIPKRIDHDLKEPRLE